MEILPADVEYDKALDRALRLLARRPYSRWEVRCRLERMGVSPEVAGKVDVRLVELGVLDDAEFAQIWVDHARGRGVAARAIKQSLKARGVTTETITEVTAGLNSDVELTRAFDLAQRKVRTYRGIGPGKAFQRLARYLQGKGYDQDTVVEVCRRVLSKSSEEGETQ